MRQPRGPQVRRFTSQDAAAAGHKGLSLAQVEAERHPVAADRGADLAERVIRRERLQPDDDARGADGERVARAIGRGNAGVQPDWHADGRYGADERVLRRAAHDRVEVCGVQLLEAQALDVRPRERVDGSDGDAGD